jgi:hypothetical protein
MSGTRTKNHQHSQLKDLNGCIESNSTGGHYTLYHNEPILLISKLPRSRRRALQEIMIPEI